MKPPISASLGKDKIDKAQIKPPKKDVQNDKCPVVTDFCMIFLVAKRYCQ